MSHCFELNGHGLVVDYAARRRLIARRADVGIGTLYGHFSDRNGR